MAYALNKAGNLKYQFIIKLCFKIYSLDLAGEL